jgi:hypothetical protein
MADIVESKAGVDLDQLLAKRAMLVYRCADVAVEAIELKLGIAFSPDAYGRLRAAVTRLVWWHRCDIRRINLPQRRRRRVRFFQLVALAYEQATGYRAGLTWNSYRSVYGGDFFEMAKLCNQLILAVDANLHVASDSRLGKVIARALKGHALESKRDRNLRRRRSPAPRSPLIESARVDEVLVEVVRVGYTNLQGVQCWVGDRVALPEADAMIAITNGAVRLVGPPP